MATHRCKRCLRKTIEDADSVVQPLVLPWSDCPHPDGHDWQQIPTLQPPAGVAPAQNTAGADNGVALTLGDVENVQYEISSPTSGAGEKLGHLGLMAMLRSPLTVTSDQLPDLAQYKWLSPDAQVPVSMVSTAEADFYDDLTSVCPRYIEPSSCKPGAQKTARTLYPNVFKHGGTIKLNGWCKPEIRAQARPAHRVSFGAEIKALDPVAMEELGQFMAISMSEANFAAPAARPATRAFYVKPPLGFAILGHGPLGFMLSVEWIGALFFAIVGDPFFLGGTAHKNSIKITEDMAVARGEVRPAIEVSSSSPVWRRAGHEGVAYAQIQGKHLKLVQVTRMIKADGNLDYAALVSEKACSDAGWSKVCTHFYHLHRVYEALAAAWKAVADSEEVDGPWRALVRSRLLYGQFEVCVESDFVGTRDITPADLSDEIRISVIVEAIVWLGLSAGLLYIDLRAPNVRVDCSGRIWLIDYDDCIVLPSKPCCGKCLWRHAAANEHLTTVVFERYPLFESLLRVRCETSFCGNC